jgi:hypothetical protein
VDKFAPGVKFAPRGEVKNGPQYSLIDWLTLSLEGVKILFVVLVAVKNALFVVRFFLRKV